MIPSTFAALAVTALAILPGAAYMFAFESRVGAFKLSAPDRIVRILVASAVFHALVSGLTYQLYKSRVINGDFPKGQLSPWLVEVIALVYLIVPYLAGLVTAMPAVRKSWLFKPFVERNYHPRAWDFVFSKGVEGIIRMRLKSGVWIAGWFRTIPGTGVESYASGYGQEADLYLTKTVVVDPESGEFHFDEDGNICAEVGAILVRWSEVEFAQLFQEDADG